MRIRGASEIKAGRWTIRCTHPDFLIKDAAHDFTILATGAGENPPNAAVAHRWKGAFTGRPELLQDLWPTLSANLANVTPRAAVVRRNALLSFWRFLDALEGHMSSEGIPFKRVVRLHDLTARHFALFSSPGLKGAWEATLDTRAVHVRGMIKAAISDHDLPDLMLPALRIPLSRRETPSEEHGLAVIRYLRSEAISIIRRWRRVDQLARRGRNLIELYRKQPKFMDMPDFVCTEEDAHATYRALIKAAGSAVPRISDLAAMFGMRGRSLPAWWARYPRGHERSGSQVNWHDMVSGCYPTSADVSTFFLLFVARSAWNPTTAASINLSDWTAEYDAQNAWLYAPKDRSRGAMQWTVSRTGETTGCHSLVSALLERTEPIRRHIKEHPKQCSLPDVVARSPWIGVTVKGGQRPVFVVDPYDTRTVNNWLFSMIERQNEASGKKSVKMTIGAFRDIAAAAIFRDSRYSSWVMMVLLGHKNLATTRSYGYRRASFEESFSLISEVIDDLFSQIKVNRVFDITLTRAKLSRLSVSDKDIERLHAARRHRTYDGSGCANPFNPPKDIDPGNPRDGCTLCVQQHRCASSGCSNCFVFTDSLEHLCRRVAELEHVRASVGLVRFEAGSDASDLERLHATLLQWPVDAVITGINKWSDRIACGEHRPVLFAGQHQ